MCPIHSDIIDDKSNNLRYPVEWLRDVKATHENKYRGAVEPTEELADQFAVGALSLLVSGPVVISNNQSGGQTAQIINNYQEREPVRDNKFVQQMRNRNLIDPNHPDFGVTRYSRRVMIKHEHGEIETLPTLGLLFAVFPSHIVLASGVDELRAWMNCNERRYEPLPNALFIPSRQADTIGNGLVWHDGHMQHQTLEPTATRFTTYLAVEIGGYVEYGFYPGQWLEKPYIYYAKVMANAVGFLRHISEMSQRFSIDPCGVSIGFGLRGIKKLPLSGIRESMRIHTTATELPQVNGHLYRHDANTLSWTVDSIACEIARGILDHWSFTAPEWVGVPEFENGCYKGNLFKKNYSGAGRFS